MYQTCSNYALILIMSLILLFMCSMIVVLHYQSLMLVLLLSVGIGGMFVYSFSATAFRSLFLGRQVLVLISGVYNKPYLLISVN